VRILQIPEGEVISHAQREEERERLGAWIHTARGELWEFGIMCTGTDTKTVEILLDVA